jgi:hypothetical protein
MMESALLLFQSKLKVKAFGPQRPSQQSTNAAA